MGVKNVKLPSFVKENAPTPDDIICEKIKHPWPQDQNKSCIMLRNVFSKKECQELIDLSEKTGYLPAMVNTGDGTMEVAKDYRNNSRCMIDSFEIGDHIFNRVKAWLPEIWDKRKLLSCNERLRFLRYYPGEFFAVHKDAMYMRDNGERSYFTVLFYLNEGFEGGHTTLIHLSDKKKICRLHQHKGQCYCFNMTYGMKGLCWRKESNI